MTSPSIEAGPDRETHVFKVVDGCAIRADAAAADSAETRAAAFLRARLD